MNNEDVLKAEIEAKKPKNHELPCGICGIKPRVYPGWNIIGHKTEEHEEIMERCRIVNIEAKQRLKDIWGYDVDKLKNGKPIIEMRINPWNRQNQLYMDLQGHEDPNIKINHDPFDIIQFEKSTGKKFIQSQESSHSEQV